MAKQEGMPLLWIGDSNTLDRPDADELAEVVRGDDPPKTTMAPGVKKSKSTKKPDAA